MKAYTIFDDFPASALKMLNKAGIEVLVHPQGLERPNADGIRKLLENYDIIIVGTGQNISEEMFENVREPRIIGTASVGTDHIRIPNGKEHLVRIVNSPTSNRITVAEHTFSLILALEKRLADAITVAERGLKKKEMQFPPLDLYGQTIGVVGAGGTAGAVLRMAQAFGMICLCWTPHPERHADLRNVIFLPLDEMLERADVISINIPLTPDTTNLISKDRIKRMKPDACLVSLSRSEIIDNKCLLKKAKIEQTFKVGLDVDADKVFGLWDSSMSNVIVTPHIGGGTIQSRIRLFEEVSSRIIEAILK